MAKPHRIFANCEACGVRFDTDWKAGRKYCSRACYGLTLRGGNHHNFKGGNISRGYRRIYVDGILVYEHRHIVEAHLGRPLRQGEVIHHKDGNRLNNSIGNLELVSSQSRHMKLHATTFRDSTHKQCTRCRETKLRDAFPPNRPCVGLSDPHDSVCKTCYNAARRLTRKPKSSG